MQKGILSKTFPRLFRTNVLTTKFTAFQSIPGGYQKIFILGSFIYLIYRDYNNSDKIEIKYISAGVKFDSQNPSKFEDLNKNNNSNYLYKGFDILLSKKSVEDEDEKQTQERNTSKNRKDDEDDSHDAKNDDKDENEKKDKKKKDGEKSDDEDDSDDDDDNGGGGLLMPVISWLGRLSRGFAPSS